MIRSKHSWIWSYMYTRSSIYRYMHILFLKQALLKFSSYLQFIGHNMVFLPVHYPCMQVLRLFFCPCDLYTCMHVFVHTWKISCHLYTLYWKNILLSNHICRACKVCVASILKWWISNRTLLNLSRSKINFIIVRRF